MKIHIHFLKYKKTNVKIIFQNGIIRFKMGIKCHKITEINQFYLVCEQIKCYRNESQDQESHCFYTAILDLLTSAGNQFINHQEIKCLENCL